MKSLSRARLLATPWTAAYQAPPSMGVSKQDKPKQNLKQCSSDSQDVTYEK